MNDDLQEWYDERALRRLRSLDKNVPVRYRGARLVEDENPEITAWVDEVLDTRPQNASDAPEQRGPSLALLGPTGVGKTHAAFGILRYLVEWGQAFMPVPTITTAPDLYAKLRPRYGVDSEAVFEDYATAGILFIDDLGAHKPSEWTEEVSYRLIDRRYRDHLVTIITSNVAPKELGERLGERVASRLNEMCTTVVLRGEDRRKRAAA